MLAICLSKLLFGVQPQLNTFSTDHCTLYTLLYSNVGYLTKYGDLVLTVGANAVLSLSSADVSITLRNKGTDAYKPELFGEAIIVDVKISREGVRTYKLKNTFGNGQQIMCAVFVVLSTSTQTGLIEHLVLSYTVGQQVSGQKDELMAILDHFNIQVQF